VQAAVSYSCLLYSVCNIPGLRRFIAVRKADFKLLCFVIGTCLSAPEVLRVQRAQDKYSLSTPAQPEEFPAGPGKTP
jgi:hypothetical protein